MSIQCRRKIIYTYSTNFDEGLRVPALLNNASSSRFFIARLEKRENLLLKTKKKLLTSVSQGIFMILI